MNKKRIAILSKRKTIKSAIKNDSSGKKQLLVSFFASLIAIVILIFSVSGASLRCTETGECEIHRKNIFTESQDDFN